MSIIWTCSTEFVLSSSDTCGGPVKTTKSPQKGFKNFVASGKTYLAPVLTLIWTTVLHGNTDTNEQAGTGW